jgi:broad specificity phosphatase PhoE
VSAPTCRLLLIRHGEVDANVEYRFLGRRDDPLNENGLAQAQRLASLASTLPIDLVVSSPKDRARTTAQAIAEATGSTMSCDQRLVELDFGDWEGLTREQIIDGDPVRREFILRWDRDPALAAPGGESLGAVQERVVGFADEIVRDHAGETLAVVSHMGPIKALLCAALGVPLTATRHLFLDPATVSVVDWSTRPVIRLVNSHAHLGWSSARWLRHPPSKG